MPPVHQVPPAAIENFAGTVLCISHDRWFLDRIATHIIAYEGDSELKFFEGGYSEYEDDLLARKGTRDPMKVSYNLAIRGISLHRGAVLAKCSHG